MLVRVCAAAVLVLALGCGTLGQKLGGIPEVWPGDYAHLVYELIHNPPPEFRLRYRLTFMVEMGVHPDGTYWARSEVEGDFPSATPDMRLADLPQFMFHTPWMALHVAYLEMLEPPFVPGETYELSPRPEFADMPPEMTLPLIKGRLEITEETLEVAGVTAVEATLTTITELDGTEIETEVWLALPQDPVLPYPVWVRPPDDSAAAWMSEIKLISFRLEPTE